MLPYKRGIGRLLAFALFVQHGALFTATSSMVDYGQIKEARLHCFGKVDPKAEKTLNETLKEMTLAQQVSYIVQQCGIRQLSDREMCDDIFKFLSLSEKTDKAFVPGTEPAVDYSVLKDIDFFVGHMENPNANLFNILNKAKTTVGQAVLTKMLAQPLDDVTLLERRQHIVRELVENDELCRRINKLLVRVKESENAFLSMWHVDDEQAFKDTVDAEYFKWLPGSAWLNKSPKALLLKSARSHYMDPVIQGGVSLLFGAIAAFSGFSAYFNKQNARGLWAFYSVACGLYSALFGWMTYVQWQLRVALFNGLQQRGMAYATMLGAAQEAENLICSFPALRDGIQYKQELFKLLAHKDADVQRLFAVLKKNTFKGKPSIFSHSGRVLVAYKQLTQTKDEFVSVMQTIGELDAYLAIANLYRESHSNKVCYNFVTFVRSDAPYLKAKGCWNPFVNPDVVVPNDIELGRDGMNRSVILTGSNTGGKSTILKAMVVSLIMAQSFGIAPVDSMSLTPFSSINTYFNITDNTAGGDSLFAAEVGRAKEMLETLKTLKPGQKGFVIIDELFTGTAPTKAEAAAYKVARHVSQFENSLFITATHFPKLTELEKELPGICKNYKIEIFKDQFGNLIRPFKMEFGISMNSIADDLLQAAMPDIDFGA